MTVVKHRRLDESLTQSRILDLYLDKDNQELVLIYPKMLMNFSLMKMRVIAIHCTLLNDLNDCFLKFQRDESKRVIFLMDDKQTLRLYSEVNFTQIASFEDINMKEFFLLKGSNHFLLQKKDKSVHVIRYNFKEFQDIGQIHLSKKQTYFIT